MKLIDLYENSIVQAGRDHLVLSIAPEGRREQFFVISDVPRITHKNFNKLYDASFKRWPGLTLFPYNLTDEDGHKYDRNFRGGPMSHIVRGMSPDEWPEYAVSGYVKNKAKDQRFTSITWKVFVEKILAEYPGGDDFED